MAWEQLRAAVEERGGIFAGEVHNRIIVSLPLTCGTCGTVDRCEGALTRWCSACGNAICPTCFPIAGQSNGDRCARCLAENRQQFPALFALGQRMAEEREKRILEAFLGK